MRAQFWERDMRLSVICPILEQQRIHAIELAEQHARDFLRSLDVAEDELQLSDIGCLRTDKDNGLQEIHADIQLHEHAPSCFIVIFYLCDTDSTAVPLHTTEELKPAWEMSIPKATRFFERITFLTTRVEAGTMMAIRGDTFHYGVGNPDSYRRYVGFMSFTPSDEKPFDSQDQYYPTGTRDGGKK